jgi:GTP:adenosylcobinamide-phosphate guanylyltransferase
MLPERVLILAAGLGTRMGSMGEVLPKILWPVFEKTLLELQIHFARELGAKTIYVNAFHQAVKIKKFLRTSGLLDEIILLEEKTLLDVGGAIHNMAARKEVAYKGDILVMNGDQFLLFDSDVTKKNLSQIDSSVYPITLFSGKVDRSLGHNGLILDPDGCMKGICPAADLVEPFTLTYLGISCVNLGALVPTSGVSKFFDSVADYGRFKVKTHTLEHFEYMDFGTLSRYRRSTFELLDQMVAGNGLLHGRHLFLDFCYRYGAIVRDKVNKDLRMYGPGRSRNLVNLSNHFVENSSSAERIILAADRVAEFTREGLYFHDIFAPFQK